MSPAQTGIYVGPMAALKGKRALLREHHGCYLLAQFDERGLTYYSALTDTAVRVDLDWHVFEHEDFELEEQET